MENKKDLSLLLAFAKEVEDFRTGNRLFYPASSILFMAFIGCLCGAESWEEIVEVSEASKDSLKQYLKEDFVGVPSHDTFERFFSLVKTQALEKAFEKVMKDAYQRLKEPSKKEVIAIDGKYAGSVTDVPTLNIVSAYATGTGLCLAQKEADKKMNEPQMLRELVSVLDIKDAVITADALHCQKESLGHILQAGGDYLICVKSNQLHLWEGIIEGIRVESIRQKARFISCAQETSQPAHGRKEKRTCYSCSHLGWLPNCGKEWAGIKSFGIVCCEKTYLDTDQTSCHRRCFISSLEKDALTQLNILRQHWKIENNLHWQLDVSFHEDDTRMKKNQLLNFSLLRKMAMPVLKAFPYKKGASIKKKMWAAALKPNIKEQLFHFAVDFYTNS